MDRLHMKYKTNVVQRQDYDHRAIMDDLMAKGVWSVMILKRVAAMSSRVSDMVFFTTKEYGKRGKIHSSWMGQLMLMLINLLLDDA